MGLKMSLRGENVDNSVNIGNEEIYSGDLLSSLL